MLRQIICVNKWSWKDLESEAGVRSPAIVDNIYIYIYVWTNVVW